MMSSVASVAQVCSHDYPVMQGWTNVQLHNSKFLESARQRAYLKPGIYWQNKVDYAMLNLKILASTHAYLWNHFQKQKLNYDLF